VTVTVRLPAVLAEIAGTRSLAVDGAPDGLTLREVLDRLAQSHPQVVRRIRDETGEVRRFVNIYVDEEDVRTLKGLDTLVADGAVMQVIPSVAGG
jgi:molybdopterin synthase sulfur carrier subunit